MTAYDAKLGLYIDGAWLTGGGRDTQDVRNPATGAVQAALPLAAAADLDLALEAAQRGFLLWRATAPEARAAILTKTAALIRERADHLARIATLEQGKIQAEAKGEALFAAALLDFHAGEAVRIYGRVLPRAPGSRSLVLQQPVGPVAAFCAWNFPIMNVVRKIAPALAAGCSIIIKPSEETSGSAVEVMRCFQDAGLPGEVAQCVFGVPDMVSRQLLASPITRKLSFTGSVPVGKHLMKLAADTMMKTTMELGGHGPVLVFDDCDLDKTIDLLVAHKFRNAGQVCVAPTRFHVQEGIYDRFAAGFAERTRALKVGDGMAADSQMGPMANPRRPEAIGAFVEDAQAKGASVLAGGDAGAGSGFFFNPTVLADVSLDARAMNEEPFGPIALLRPFATVDDAIEQANRLPFGLAAYCFTENGRRQNLLGDAIEAGMVGINSVKLSAPDSPFGGIKDSGHGSEDGPEGVAAHLITKTVHMV
ncbi:NAD-dependent succinate-semialdehyde dehydrogenase [Sphingomonas sp. GB1N7]|uniref:NAD-dependent succinate-semialdehyde dehydrogenase n=1 Tax=Parasphingomonas caseinilytica TaxID=3096158 RepID=UPI002FC92CCD